MEPTLATSPVTEEIQRSFLQSAALFMDEGGIFMWIIFTIWTIGIAIALERYKSLFMYDINAKSFMAKIKKHVLENQVHQAIQLCSNSKSLLPLVIRGGLKRANQSKEQIQDSLEASALEVVPEVDKRMNYLALLANISTLLGLLGTIYGLIQSFSAVATADPSSKAKLLALGISKAMNTTAIGLISAITIMVIHSILTTKAEKIVTDIDEQSVKLVDLLSTKNRNMYITESPTSEIRDEEKEEHELPPAPLQPLAAAVGE